MKVLLFCIICSNNCMKYINHMLYSLIKTTKNINDFEIVIGVNSNVKIDAKLVNHHKNLNIKTINVFDEHIKHVGLSHGTAVNKLINEIAIKNDQYKKYDYFMMVDTDIVFLKKNWDVDIFQMFEQNRDKNYVVGTQANKTYKRKRYLSYPCVFVFLFRSNLFDHFIPDFRPVMDKTNTECINIKINTPELSKIHGVSINTELHMDTGAKLPEMLYKYNYKCTLFNSIDFDQKNCKFTNKKELDELNKKIINNIKKNKDNSSKGIGKLCEFHYNNELYFSHLGESSRRNFDVDLLSKYWIENSLKYFK